MHPSCLSCPTGGVSQPPIKGDSRGLWPIKSLVPSSVNRDLLVARTGTGTGVLSTPDRLGCGRTWDMPKLGFLKLCITTLGERCLTPVNPGAEYIRILILEYDVLCSTILIFILTTLHIITRVLILLPTKSIFGIRHQLGFWRTLVTQLCNVLRQYLSGWLDMFYSCRPHSPPYIRNLLTIHFSGTEICIWYVEFTQLLS